MVGIGGVGEEEIVLWTQSLRNHVVDVYPFLLVSGRK